MPAKMRMPGSSSSDSYLSRSILICNRLEFTGIREWSKEGEWGTSAAAGTLWRGGRWLGWQCLESRRRFLPGQPGLSEFAPGRGPQEKHRRPSETAALAAWKHSCARQRIRPCHHFFTQLVSNQMQELVAGICHLKMQIIFC